MYNLYGLFPAVPCKKEAVASAHEAYAGSTNIKLNLDGVGELRSSSTRSGSWHPMTTRLALAANGGVPVFLSR